jgi:hypothetical protein
MAAKRAKLALDKKKVQRVPEDPESGKPMTACRVLRKDGSSGMHWVVIEDFKGTEDDEARMIPCR